MNIIVRTAEPVDRVATRLRDDLARVDPDLPAGAIEAVTDIVGRSVSRWRFAAWLVSAFAGIALCLSAVGLFAVVAATVSERTAEIGVRIALGAGRHDVLRTVLNRSLGVTLAGTAAGLGLALATTRFLAMWLVDVSPLDRSAFAGASALMVLVALAASWMPARRAMRIDPVQALRNG
jgi:ABC-type antimicrobial peptide transport system permease subunit